MKELSYRFFKNNDPNDVNNYRGITLVSCLSKVFTGILNDIISDAEFGFRKERSTTDAIIVLDTIIQHVLTNIGRLYCALLLI